MDGKFELKIKKDGEFKILQLTDIHLGCGILSREEDALAIEAVKKTVKATAPDLIVVTGDSLYPVRIFSGTGDNRKEARVFGNLMESFGVPWTQAFGNHDSELRSKWSKTRLAEYYKTLPHCIFTEGEDFASLAGLGKRRAARTKPVGNFTLDIVNSDNSGNTTLFLMDSNARIGRTFLSRFDNIHGDQVEWYRRVVEEIKRRPAATAQSFLFCHIPISEFADAWNLSNERLRRRVSKKLGWRISGKFRVKRGGKVGVKLDKKKEKGVRIALLRRARRKNWHKPQIQVRRHFGARREPMGENYFGVPDSRGEIFDAILDGGHTKAVFCGHDHLNTFSVTYRGVRLTYGLSIDYLAYRRYGIKNLTFQRGGTVITLQDKQQGFSVEQVHLVDIE